MLLVTTLCVPLFAQQASVHHAEDLIAKGSVNEAVDVLRLVLADEPENADAHLLLGTVLALQGARSESIEELKTAVRLRPDSAVAHERLGSALSRFVEMNLARQEFERATELDPNYAQAHVSLSLVLAQQGELDAAGAHLDRAIELQGNSAAAAYTHYFRSKVWAGENQVEKALAELDVAVGLRPDFAEAWSDLGGVRRIARDSEGAEKALAKSVALDPENALAQYRLGQVELENGRTGEAIQHLQIALQYAPDDRATLYNLMRGLRKAGRSAEAEVINDRFSKLLQAGHHASDVGFAASELNSEGIELEKSGDIESAVGRYKAALGLDPTGFGFRLNYALGLCRLGRWQEGAEELQMVLKVDPDNADARKALYIAADQVTKREHVQHR